jgi:hypothetical protein
VCYATTENHACTAPDMKRHSNARVMPAHRGHRTAAGGAYIFFCGSIVVTVGLLIVSGFFLPPRVFEFPELTKRKAPVAKIELVPDREGQCRHLLFHNDSGRFEEAGKGRCSGLTPDEQILADEAAARRSEALKRVFKFRN